MPGADHWRYQATDAQAGSNVKFASRRFKSSESSISAPVQPLGLKEREISVVGIPRDIPVDKLGPNLRAWLVSTDAESGTVEVKMVVDNKCGTFAR